MSWKLQIFSAFPDFFPGPLAHSLIGKAKQKAIWHDEIINLRDFATDIHQSVDAPPYGGGAGMIMRSDVVDKALHAKLDPKCHLILPSPRGKQMTQDWCAKMSKTQGIAIICNRYQGIDERIIKLWKPEMISIGDYIVAGGETAAIVIGESCIRLLDQVISNHQSFDGESYNQYL
ncbi:MAG: tRNA (guanosine(37)-N1)-methyltransferase TrmD, partial [Pseudomonadota bacterium]